MNEKEKSQKESQEEPKEKTGQDNSLEFIDKICQDNNCSPEHLIRHILRSGLANNNQRKILTEQLEKEYTFYRDVAKRNHLFIDYIESNIKVETFNRKGFPTTIEEIDALIKKSVSIEKTYIEKINKIAEELRLANEKVHSLIDHNDKQGREVIKLTLERDNLSQSLSSLQLHYDNLKKRMQKFPHNLFK